MSIKSKKPHNFFSCTSEFYLPNLFHFHWPGQFLRICAINSRSSFFQIYPYVYTSPSIYRKLLSLCFHTIRVYIHTRRLVNNKCARCSWANRISRRAQMLIMQMPRRSHFPCERKNTFVCPWEGNSKLYYHFFDINKRLNVQHLGVTVHTTSISI